MWFLTLGSRFPREPIPCPALTSHCLWGATADFYQPSSSLWPVTAISAQFYNTRGKWLSIYKVHDSSEWNQKIQYFISSNPWASTYSEDFIWKKRMEERKKENRKRTDSYCWKPPFVLFAPLAKIWIFLLTEVTIISLSEWIVKRFATVSYSTLPNLLNKTFSLN